MCKGSVWYLAVAVVAGCGLYACDGDSSVGVVSGDVCSPECDWDQNCENGKCVNTPEDDESCDPACGKGEVCDDSVCKPDPGKKKTCDPACGSDEKCVDGVCEPDSEGEDTCDPVCGENEKCVDGVCKPDSEGEKTCEPACGENEKCVDGICKPDSGDEKNCEPACEDGQECVDGSCRDIVCDPACEEGQDCVKGACVDKVCDPACEDWQECVKGACVDKACDPACIDGQECIKGVCLPELCGGIICPENTKCYQDVCHDNSEFCGSEICTETQKCAEDHCVELNACDSTKCPADHFCAVSSGGLPICYTNACSENGSLKSCSEGTICVAGECIAGKFEEAAECKGGYLDEHGKCIVPLKSISITAKGIETGTVDVLLESTEKFTIVYDPENTTERGVKWTMVNVDTGKDDVSKLVKVSGEDTDVLAMKGISVLAGDIDLKATSSVHNNISAAAKVAVKPYFALRPGDEYADYNKYRKGDLKCNAYDERNQKVFNRDLYEKFVQPKMVVEEKDGKKIYKPTRASVVAAARFLSMQFPYYFPYLLTSMDSSHYVWSSSKYVKNEDDVRIYGLRLTDKSYGDYEGNKVNATKVTPWACKKSDKVIGLECSGFVTWALRNGRFNAGDWKTSYLNGGPSGKGSYLSQSDSGDSKWGWNTNNRHDKVKAKFAKLAKSDFVKVKDAKPDQVHAGDLMWHEGHIGMVVGVKRKNQNDYSSAEYVYIAEATSSSETHKAGNTMTRYTWSKFVKSSKWAKSEKTSYIVRMDHVYTYFTDKGNEYDDFW